MRQGQELSVYWCSTELQLQPREWRYLDKVLDKVPESRTVHLEFYNTMLSGGSSSFATSVKSTAQIANAVL